MQGRSQAVTSVATVTQPGLTPLTVRTTDINGLFIVTMKQVEDEREVVREFYRQSAWEQVGLPSLGPFVQINITESRCGAVRGLHGEAMNKVVAIAGGEAFGAYVDAREGSVTYGAVVTVALVAGQQVVVPNGVGNGFQTVSDTSQYLYCFDAEWQPGMAGVAVNPMDPTLGIPWPLAPVLSDKMPPRQGSGPAAKSTRRTQPLTTVQDAESAPSEASTDTFATHEPVVAPAWTGRPVPGSSQPDTPAGRSAHLPLV